MSRLQDSVNLMQILDYLYASDRHEMYSWKAL